MDDRLDLVERAGERIAAILTPLSTRSRLVALTAAAAAELEVLPADEHLALLSTMREVLRERFDMGIAEPRPAGIVCLAEFRRRTPSFRSGA